ncbi:MAG: aminopeptidase P family protein [Calditrichaeota bacterium]|nr:aminopeptidase P family protein [Calditrichota bacterium]
MHFILLITIVFNAITQDYQTDFPKEEFKARRDKVFEFIGKNVAFIQGEAVPRGSYQFRQSNTFYYLTGLESHHSYIFMNGRSKQTIIYMPHRDSGRERTEGPLFFAEDVEKIKELTGVDDVRPIEELFRDLTWGALVRLPNPALYTEFSPLEGTIEFRDQVIAAQAEYFADPWDQRPSRRGRFIQLIRERYPQFEIRDLTPKLDDMRLIKSKREIDLIRKASEIAGMGIMEAMRSTQANVMEYQLRAAAFFVFLNNGSRSEAYAGIVGGGTNAWYGHYSRNTKPLKNGDLVLLDMAPDYHYYSSDVTRCWPVNGKFSKDQRDLFGFAVRYKHAFLNYIKPGATADGVLEKAAKEMRPVWESINWSKDIYKKAAEKALTFKGHMQHPVGMSVHDVGVYKNKPFEPGLVFSVDPMIWVPEENLYIRLEDVVVVTEDGVEVLSDNLTDDLDEIERLIAEDGIVQKRPANY